MAGPLKGYHMFLDLYSPANWNREMREGKYDSFIYKALTGYNGIVGATVWDIGAHIGYHSLAFASLVGPSGHVVAFEPNPYNIDRFCKNLQRNPQLAERIILKNCALSNVDGEASFLFSSEVDDGRSTGSHLEKALVPENPEAYRSFKRTNIAALKADTIMRDKLTPLPSIVKLDVEGAEQLVLEGAVVLLSTQKPLLFIEVHNITMMFYVQKILNSLGYNMEILDAEHSSLSRCFVMARHDSR
jgi:FkbM family methyltransferase